MCYGNLRNEVVMARVGQQHRSKERISGGKRYYPFYLLRRYEFGLQETEGE